MNRFEMRKVAGVVAKKHRGSRAEVMRDMQAAINATYENPTPAALNIPRKGNVPTVREFISYTAASVAVDMKR